MECICEFIFQAKMFVPYFFWCLPVLICIGLVIRVWNMIIFSERPRIEIFTSQYYVGEDATITAHLTNPLEILCSTWQKAATNGTQALDTTLPKYSETKDSDSDKILRIKNCSEEDTGIYFLLAACFDGTEISSNKTEMKIVKGCPTVMITTNPQSREKFQHGYEGDGPIHITSVIYHGCVEFKAKIRSFPKQSHLVWMKGSSNIDLSDPKYKGSSIYGDNPVLLINMVTNDDKDIYRLEARNDCGKGTSNPVALEIYGDIPKVLLDFSSNSQSLTYGNTVILEADVDSKPSSTLIQWKKNGENINVDDKKFSMDSAEKNKPKLSIKVLNFKDDGEYSITVRNALGSAEAKIEIKVGVNQLFISGPVVVMRSAKIHFSTILPENMTSNVKSTKWNVTTKQRSNEIDFLKPGFSIGTDTNIPITQHVKIEKATDNGAYQLSLDDMKSNIINVIVDGHIFFLLFHPFVDAGKYSTEKEGNLIRFFALMHVGRDAMKKKLNTASGYSSSSNDEDITKIYGIFRNVLKIQPPKKGWGKKPAANEQGTADDLERIRMYRNKLCHHSSSEMPTDDFNKIALDLIRAIQRLSNNDEELIKQISGIMNKVVTKGDEMNRLLEEISEFRENAKIVDSHLNAEHTEKEINKNTILDGNLDIGFHTVHSSGICLLQNNTVARNENGGVGICFMGRPMKIGEEIYLHILKTNSDWWTSMDFGLTNKLPSSVLDKYEDKGVVRLKFMPGLDDVLCLCLKENSTLSNSINDVEQDALKFKNVSLSYPVWLVIHLYCRIKEIRISGKRIKEEKVIPSFFREYC